MLNDTQDSVEKNKTKGRSTHARVLLLLAIVACLALVASDCSKSHVQETVTVAPRTTATPAPAITIANFSSGTRTLDAETEATGDALSHAIVALKGRRRDEALHYMNFARIQLTRLVSRFAANTTGDSNATRERLIEDLHELDAAERSARRNDFVQSAAQLVSITNELDHLSEGLNPRQN